MKTAVRLKDIAEGMGVSITTVSKAMNNHPDISEKRKKEILDYARQMNYTPNQVARGFRKQATNLIGVVLNDNSDPLNARLLRGIEETLAGADYQAIVMNTHESAETEVKLITQLRGLNVAGVIMMPAPGGHKTAEVLREFGIPAVQVTRYLDKDEGNYIISDDYEAGFKAADYLCTYGNEKLYFLNYLDNVSSTEERLRGYKDALKKHGIPYDPSLVISGCRDQSDGYDAMKSILQTCRLPVSVMCYSDYIATGAISAVQEMGLDLPKDVALMGNGDISILSFVKPRLTTIGVQKLRMGVKSAEVLLDLIRRSESGEGEAPEGAEVSERVILKSDLIIRETA